MDGGGSVKIDLNNLLKLAVIALGEYRKGRDAVIAAGDPTDPNTGTLKSDAELIALLKQDASAAVQQIDNLLDKHSDTDD
jgi:hypothetical protein